MSRHLLPLCGVYVAVRAGGPAWRGRRVSAAVPTVVDVMKPLPVPVNRAKGGGPCLAPRCLSRCECGAPLGTRAIVLSGQLRAWRVLGVAGYAIVSAWLRW